MRHLFLFAAATALATPAMARVPTEEALPKPVQKLGEAMRAANGGACGKAIRLARPLAEPKGGLNEIGMSLALAMIAQCEFNTGDKASAAATARRATALDGAPDEVWHDRLRLDLMREDGAAAVETVEAMTQGRGEALNKADMGWLWQLHRALKDARRDDLRERLLKVLTNPAYAPAEPLSTADGFRLAYARMLADAGKNEAARELIGDISSPRLLADASLDARLRGFLPADVDVRAAWEARLREAMRAATLHPDLLDPLLEVADALRRLGRPADALKVLKPTLSMIDTPGVYRDQAEKLNWLHDSFGRTYAALGQYDDSVAAFRAGVGARENGSANISQVINLAYAQVLFGKGEDALRTLAAFDDPALKGSPYGESEMRLARGCARAVAGRPAEASTEIVYLRAHEKDHPEALTDVLLCVKDMDGAAEAMIRRLDDPDRRAGALEQLSDYDAPQKDVPRGPIALGLDELKARPDIKAAIARAGGVRRFRVQPSEL